MIKEHVKPSQAKAGVVAPCSCTIPKGPTGLDPAQTSFFQALNIATKINKGAIEIVNDCQVIHEGLKVGSSEAALLHKLGLKPFTYGLAIKYVWEGGVFPVDVLRINDAVLTASFMNGVGNVAAVSLAVGYPTEAALAHSSSRAPRTSPRSPSRSATSSSTSSRRSRRSSTANRDGGRRRRRRPEAAVRGDAR